MPAPNRVTPFGEIVALDQRGLFMGNRGCIHRAPYEIARPWQVRRWITCALAYKDWVAPRWEPGRWTALFFWDEAVALAAGHRPCALCRRPDYEAWRAAWQAAFGVSASADAMDRRLHADRVVGRSQRRHARPWADVPPGAFVALGEGADERAGEGEGEREGDGQRPRPAALVLPDRLVPWSPAGYGPPVGRPAGGEATVLTPRATVEVLRAGYRPALHPTAASPPSPTARPPGG